MHRGARRSTTVRTGALVAAVVAALLVGATIPAGPVGASGDGAQAAEDGGGGEGGDVGPWQNVTLSTTGDAGEWLVFHQPLPEPLTEIEFEFTVTVTATGDPLEPVGLFTSRPTLTIDWGDGVAYRPSHTFEERGPLFMDRDGGTLTYDRNERWSAAVGGGNFTGFFFVVGSNAPWSADVTVQVKDAEGGTIDPEFLSEGSGVVLIPEGDQVSGLPNGALIGTIELDTTIDEPGWTHLQYDYDELQPDGEREYDIAFPDVAWSGTGMMTGYHLVGGTASSSNWFDYFGAIRGSAGLVDSRLDYTQAQSRMDAALIHMPMGDDDLPASFLDLPYANSNWPFQDRPGPLVLSDGPGQTLTMQRLG